MRGLLRFLCSKLYSILLQCITHKKERTSFFFVVYACPEFRSSLRFDHCHKFGRFLDSGIDTGSSMDVADTVEGIDSMLALDLRY